VATREQPTKPEHDQHRKKIQHALFKRDYDILAEYYPELLEMIEAAVNAGVEAARIKVWAGKVSSEETFLQRIFNAARWLETEKIEAYGGEKGLVFDAGPVEEDKSGMVRKYREVSV
jgi:hypothetical protein